TPVLGFSHGSNLRPCYYAIHTDRKFGLFSFSKYYRVSTLKSGNHEIPLHQQLNMYQSIFRVLKPRGLLVNLGFLFDDVAERDQFREIARCKDSLAGMQSAVDNRHFLTRDELYTRL